VLSLRTAWKGQTPIETGVKTAKIAVLTSFALLAGCQMTATNKVSVDYYAISGNSTAALDQQIRQKGPRIGDGRHAVAVARIRMTPNIRYQKTARGCRAKSAKVAVNARVTLPRWTGRGTASRAVGKAWDNIDRYTRLHEAVHVAIAFRYANATEREILEAQPQRTCADMKTVTSAIVARNLELHDKAQKAFDAKEQRRFAAIAKRRSLATKKNAKRAKEATRLAPQPNQDVQTKPDSAT